MPLGLEKIAGLGNIGNIGNIIENSITGFTKFIILLILFSLCGLIYFLIFNHKKNKKLYDKKIFWFEEVNGQMIPTDEDNAMELTIPASNIKVFYIKKKDMYLPRGVIKTGKDSYWYCIRNNREIVNFRLANLNKEMKEARLDFDHTDMRYALVNLLALIKRNYRDKSQPWWREYKDLISIVVLIFVMTLSFIFIVSRIGNLVNSLTPLIEKIGVLIDRVEVLIKATQTVKGSGVVLG